MKKLIWILFVICCALGVSFVILPQAGWSATPERLSYEGRLTDSSGNPIAAAKTINFRIYDAVSGGNVIWGPESINVTPDSQGVFSVVLGSSTPITSAVFSGASRYLEISVAGETLSPRTQITSAGYAFMAANAQGVEDGVVTRAKVASGNFVKQVIAGSGITVSGDEGKGTGQITITAQKIIDHGTTAMLIAGSVTTNFIATFSAAPTVIITPIEQKNFLNGKKWPHVSSTTAANFTISADNAYNGLNFNWIAIGN